MFTALFVIVSLVVFVTLIVVVFKEGRDHWEHLIGFGAVLVFVGLAAYKLYGPLEDQYNRFTNRAVPTHEHRDQEFKKDSRDGGDHTIVASQ